MCQLELLGEVLSGESDHIIPKGNLGNVMKSLGEQDPNQSLKPLDVLTPTMQPLEDLKIKSHSLPEWTGSFKMALMSMLNVHRVI